MDAINAKNKNLRVGYTVFTGLIIFMIFIIMIGTEGNYFSKTYNLNMLVSSADGLVEGSKVSLGGLNIGQIDKIDFVNMNNQNLVLLKLSLLEEYSKKITKTSVAQIKTTGLLGDKIIDISLGGENEQPLNDGDYIQVQEALSLDKLATKVEPLIENLNKVASNLCSITEKINNGDGAISKLLNDKKSSEKLDDFIDNLYKFSQSLNENGSTLGKLINSDELYKKVDNLTANLNKTVKKVNSGKGSIGKLLNDDTLYNKLDKIAENLEKVSQNITEDSSIVGGLLNNPYGYKRLENLIENINALIKDLKENPSKYIDVSVF